jgi:type II secretory pathway component PulK
MSSQKQKCSGSILVCVLICLVIVSGIATSMLKSALQARQLVRQERQLTQTQFLLEAGIQRAVAQLRENPNYQGETWRLAAEAIPGHKSAQVEIKVTTASNEGSATSVQVVAQLGADAPLPIQRSYTFSISNEE